MVMGSWRTAGPDRPTASGRSASPVAEQAATFVGSGLGFAWLPRHMIERELKEGVLKQLPLEKGGSRNPTFYLYSNKDKPLGPATQILVELLRTFDTAPLDAPFAAPQQA